MRLVAMFDKTDRKQRWILGVIVKASLLTTTNLSQPIFGGQVEVPCPEILNDKYVRSSKHENIHELVYIL